MLAVRFDPVTKAVIGDAVGVFDGLRTNNWSNGDFSLSAAGHLLSNRAAVWAPTDGSSR